MFTGYRSTRVLGLVLFSTMGLQAAGVSTDKGSYLVLDPIVISFSGLAANNGGLVAIAKSGAAAGSWDDYQWTSGKTSGSLTFAARQDPGDYEARVYEVNNNVVSARSSFKVSYPATSITTNKANYQVLEKIVVSWSNMPGYGTDIIRIAPVGSPGDAGPYQWTSSAKSGTVTFDPQEPGKYEARAIYRNDNIPRVVAAFTVSYPTPTISTSKTGYQVLEPITVTWGNMPGYDSDIIRIAPVGAPGTDGIYQWTNSKISGSVTFGAQEPGTWEARAIFRNDGTVRAKATFTVSYPVPTIATDKTAYQVLEPIKVSFGNMPGYGEDIIRVAPAGSTGDAATQYGWTSKAISGTLTFDPLEPGTYEARAVFRNDNVVRAKATFTVAYPTPTVSTSKSSYLVLEKVPITWGNMPGYDTDIIRVGPVGNAGTTEYQWTAHQKSGSLTFGPFEPGNYEARAVFRNDDVVRAKSTFSVVYPVPLLNTNKSGYLPTEKITATFSNMPGYSQDIIRLGKSGTTSTIDYQWTNGTKSGSVVFGPLDPGNYEVWAMFRNDDVLRARAAFTVSATPPNCTYSISPTSASVGISGGSGSFAVSAGTGCLWTVQPGASWIHVANASASGSGNGTVSYAVDANTATARSSAITIAGGPQTLTFTLDQAGSAAPLFTTSADPGSVTSSMFYYPNLASNTGSAQYSSAFDVRDMFGGTFSTSAGESGHSVFTDTVPASGYYSVAFQTKTPVQVDNLTLYLAEDGGSAPSSRSATHVTILAGNSAGSLAVLADQDLIPIGSSYAKQLGVTAPAGLFAIQVQVPLANSPTYQYFEVRLTPNNGVSRGVRVLEFTGTGRAVSAPGVPVYYRFESGSAGAAATGAGSIADSSGSGQNATPSGTLTYSLDVPVATVGGQSNKLSLQVAANGVVRFDGAFPLNNTTNATLELWVKPTGTASAMDLLWTRTDSTDANRFNMEMLSTSTSRALNFDYRDPDGALHPVASGIPLAVIGWTHVAIVKAGNTWTSYANGVQSGQVVDASPRLPTNTGWTFNGRGINAYVGLIDELRISTTALTPSQFLYVAPAPACTYAISPASTPISAGGGNGNVAVTATSGCAWTATRDQSFVTITSGASGAGNGTVAYTATANTTGGARNATITVTGGSQTLTHSVTQVACGYTVSPVSASIAGIATNGTFSVTPTASGCGWTAKANADWIHLTSSTNGSATATVSWSVDANPDTTKGRSGTVSVADKTFTVNQDAGCAFTLNPAAANFTAAGGMGSVDVTASGSSCVWNATTAAGWMYLTSDRGTGSGTARYQVSANTDTAQRGDSLMIAGIKFPVTQDGVSPIKITSVANAASLIPAVTSAGGIAQGAVFSVTGTALGPGSATDPTTGVAGVVPYGTSLGGVTVKVTQGTTSVDAYVVFAWTGRVDAIMPSTMATGGVTVTVSYNGYRSDASPATVVASNFGAYATNGRSGGRALLMVQASATDPGVQNSNTVTAKPGQYVTLLGTGLGAINGPDNTSPPTADLPVVLQLLVIVGGKQAVTVHASRVAGQPGKDAIQFLVPPDAPPGCNTPVQVITGFATYSNIVMMAVDADGQPCTSINPWSGVSEGGGKRGDLMLLRVKASMALSEDQPPVSILLDEGVAVFTNNAPGGNSLIGILSSLPSLGTCGTLGGALNVGSLLGSQSASGVAGNETVPYLDAGPAITVAGPMGTGRMMPGQDSDGNRTLSMYSGALAMTSNGQSSPDRPEVFLEPGDYTITGEGGKDVGAFQATISIPPALTWSNKDDMAAIDRANGVTFTWGGGSDQQLVMLLGLSSDTATNSTGGFACFVPSKQGTFTVTAPVLANLPVADKGTLGAVVFGTVPAGSGSTFTASGIDSGSVVYGTLELKTVGVK